MSRSIGSLGRLAFTALALTTGLVVLLLIAVQFPQTRSPLVEAAEPAFTPFADFEEQPAGSSSKLVLPNGEEMSDREFVNLITATLGITNCQAMIFVFGQCYGGGFIDELARAGFTCTLSAQSGARWDEVAYGYSGEDGTTTYLQALVQQLVMSPTMAMAEAAKRARENDPKGANQTKNKPEHPQYYGSGPMSATVTITGAQSFHAVLFAGAPNAARHWNNLEHMYHTLTATYGYTPGQISVLYGDGNWPGPNERDVDGAYFPLNPGIPISPATRSNLSQTLMAIGPQLNSNEQFFWWSSDHGDIGVAPTAAAGPGEGTCTGPVACAVPMTLTLAPAQLALLNPGADLEFTYRLLVPGTGFTLNVCFNSFCAPFTVSPTGQIQARLPLSPQLFLADNVLSFTLQGGPSSLASLGISNAIVDLGPVGETPVPRVIFTPIILSNSTLTSTSP